MLDFVRRHCLLVSVRCRCRLIAGQSENGAKLMNRSGTSGANDRSWRRAMVNGVRAHCPDCGQGRLYWRYLKVRDVCEVCGLEVHHHRADDAPPYFTMLILGHLIVPLALMLERAAAPPVWLHFSIWLPLAMVLTLALLPRVKGALIGLQWANRMHGFGAEGDAAHR